MTDPADGLVVLAMYPFDSVRDALDRLWPLIRQHLGFGPDALAWDVDLQSSWQRPDLLLGQTCGWPLVSQLGESVEVIGVFDAAVPEARDGTYRSVLVSSSPAPLDVQLANADLRLAVNNDDSLSGYVSLRTVCAQHGRRVNAPIFTGAHLASVRSIASAQADLASVDAVSWALICQSEPDLVEGLHVVGHGPRVPCLPLICAAGSISPDGRPLADQLRHAVAAACREPAATDLLTSMLARGFVAKSAADYAPLRRLAGAV